MDDAVDEAASAVWDQVLKDGHGSLVRARRVFRYLPSSPRCKLCNNPFGGVGGRISASPASGHRARTPTSARGAATRFRPAAPRWTSPCCSPTSAAPRGSASRSGRPTSRALLNRFYAAATQTLLRHDAVIDKLIGDEVMAFFVHGITARTIAVARWRRASICSGRSATARSGPWIELGVAVDAGVAYVGNVGSDVVDFTALGIPSTSPRACSRAPRPASCSSPTGCTTASRPGHPAGRWRCADVSSRSRRSSSAPESQRGSRCAWTG